MEKLQNGNFYHIFNRGINSTTIFKQEADFNFFLILMQKYLLAISDIYCFALMRNHFHILLKIKEKCEIPYLGPYDPTKNEAKWNFLNPDDLEKLNLSEDGLKKPNPTRMLSHLFNTYTKNFNNKYKRTGSLFEKNFKRIEINNEEYLVQLVCYIHYNPLHHGIAVNYIDYPWTSYHEFIREKQSFLDKKTVINWFDNIENFVNSHQQVHESSLIQDYTAE